MKQYMLTENEIRILEKAGEAATREKEGLLFVNHAAALESVTVFGEIFTESAHMDAYGYTWKPGSYFFLAPSGDRLEVKLYRYGRKGQSAGYSTPEAINAHALLYGPDMVDCSPLQV